MKINGVEIELEEGMELVVEKGGKRLVVRSAPSKPLEVQYPPMQIAAPFLPQPFHPFPCETPYKVTVTPVPYWPGTTTDPMPNQPYIWCGNSNSSVSDSVYLTN